MEAGSLPPRFRGLPVEEVLGRRLPVAATRRARLLGLAVLAPEQAGPGLLIPRCRSVHTFGMRFAIDVLFVGPEGDLVDSRLAVGPRKVLRCPAARSVVELPARRPGGEDRGAGA